jgi:phage N-6-adenine-methyltransferase
MLHFSHDSFETPPALYDYWNARYGGFELDAAATAANSKCPKFFADLFARDYWGRYARRIWMNPPYSGVGRYVAKAHLEAQRGGCTIVALILTPNGERFWHDHVIGHATRVVFIAGRVSFLHPLTHEPVKGNRFGSVAVIYEEGKIDTGHTELESIKLSELCLSHRGAVVQ